MSHAKLLGIGALCGLLAALPARAEDEEIAAEEAAKKALSGGGDPRKIADKVLEPLPGALDELMQKSKDRPEKVLQSWDLATGERLRRFRELTSAAEGPSFKRALPADWKEYRRSREAFVEVLRAEGKDAALWRHQTRLLVDSLKTAISTFPARRAEWQKRIAGVDEAMGRGEALLKASEPDPQKVDAAIVELTSAGTVAANVGFDASVVGKQSGASLGKAVVLPANVLKAQQAFAGIDEAHKDVPEGWRGTVRGWADTLKQGLGAQRAAQEEFDKVFGDVVKYKVFEGSGHFRGKPYGDFPLIVSDLIAKLRLLRQKGKDRAEVARLMKEDRERNARECKEFREYMEATNAEKNREAMLKHARGCGAVQCHDKKLEAARGPCSATGIREAQLKVSRLSFAREEARQFQEMLLKNKGNTAEDRAKIQKRIEELSRESQEELDLARFLTQCESNTLPEQKKLDEAAENVCASKGPECKQFNDEWDEFQKDQERRIKEQRKRDRQREERRRKIGLKPDTDYRDCP